MFVLCKQNGVWEWKVLLATPRTLLFLTFNIILNIMHLQAVGFISRSSRQPVQKNFCFFLYLCPSCHPLIPLSVPDFRSVVGCFHYGPPQVIPQPVLLMRGKQTCGVEGGCSVLKLTLKQIYSIFINRSEQSKFIAVSTQNREFSLVLLFISLLFTIQTAVNLLLPAPV